MAFEKDFDELLNELLTDYRNQFPEADTSQGSLLFIRSACLASAAWGLYKYQEYILQQVFPDTADTATLEHHAWVRGLTRKEGEQDSDLLARLLEYIRRPPAGGNKYDYVKWALSVTGVGTANCFPLGNGLGTVDVVVTADPDLNSGSMIPEQTLLDEVKAYIETVRPVTAWSVRVLAPEILTINITAIVSGSANKPQTIADITSFMNTFTPGQQLFLAQIVNLCVINGAENVTITAPAYTITPLNTQIIRPGVVSVA